MSEFGPLLPPRLTQKREDEANEEDTGLSPRLGRTRVENTSGKAVELTSPSGTFGPTLPPGLSSSTPADGKSRSATIGPVLPAHLDSNTKEEEVIIGPLPPSVGSLEEDELARKRMEIEARSVSMRKKLTRQDEDLAPRREGWMTELPSDVKVFGLGPRKFCSTYIDPGDRSVWTDTPADRLRKEQQASQEGPKEKKKKSKKQVEEETVVSSRDRELARQVEEYNRNNRSESMVQIHRKRKTAEDPQEMERRPFNRDTDLEVPHRIITSSKRQALVKDSARSLDSKFTHGKRQFL